MTVYWSVHQGFIIMLISVFLGFTFSFGGGYMIDYFVQEMYKNPHMADADGTLWEDLTENNMQGLINMYYFICCIFPLLGIGVFILTILKRQQYDDEYWRFAR